MGGRVVGEFGADAAVLSANTTAHDADDGKPRLGPHGIRVGDVVRVMEVASSASARKSAREHSSSNDAAGGKAGNGAEGVVTKVSDKALSIAFGQTGGGGNNHVKQDEEAVDELWGKKLWL